MSPPAPTRRPNAARLLDEYLDGVRDWLDVVRTIPRIPGIAHDLVGELQARREGGRVSRAMANRLIDSVTEEESFRIGDDTPVIRAIDARTEEIEREHGLAEGEAFDRLNGPPEWRMLTRAWEGYMVAIQVRLLESLGERELAEAAARFEQGDDALDLTDAEVAGRRVGSNDSPRGSALSLVTQTELPRVPASEPFALEIDPDELLEALEDGTEELTWYLHRDSGLLTVTSDFGDSADDDEELFDDRWLVVERPDGREAFRYMEGFARTRPDGPDRQRLLTALNEPNPFRRFREALGDDRPLRDAWEAYRSEQLLRFAAEWLESEGIQPVWKSRTRS